MRFLRVKCSDVPSGHSFRLWFWSNQRAPSSNSSVVNVMYTGVVGEVRIYWCLKVKSCEETGPETTSALGRHHPQHGPLWRSKISSPIRSRSDRSMCLQDVGPDAPLFKEYVHRAECDGPRARGSSWFLRRWSWRQLINPKCCLSSGLLRCLWGGVLLQLLDGWPSRWPFPLQMDASTDVAVVVFVLCDEEDLERLPLL